MGRRLRGRRGAFVGGRRGLRRAGAARRGHESGQAPRHAGGPGVRARVRREWQADRRHLPWSLDTDRRRPGRRQEDDVVAEPGDRPGGSTRRWWWTVSSSPAASRTTFPRSTARWSRSSPGHTSRRPHRVAPKAARPSPRSGDVGPRGPWPRVARPLRRWGNPRRDAHGCLTRESGVRQERETRPTDRACAAVDRCASGRGPLLSPPLPRFVDGARARLAKTLARRG